MENCVGKWPAHRHGCHYSDNGSLESRCIRVDREYMVQYADDLGITTTPVAWALETSEQVDMHA